jgi:pyridoxal 5'-phosphate synthase pdxT subunit
VTNPTVGVLALQGDVREHRQAFERCGVPTREVRLPADFERIDALSMPGGESTTMSRLLRVFGLEPPLRARLDEGMACFATCAGMILLSRRILDGRPDQLALGALDLDVRRNGWGRQVDSFEVDLRIPALPADGEPPPFHAVFIRAPRVERCGAGVDVLASIDDNPVVVAQGPHLALAFHPEMTPDDRLHRLFLERLHTRMASAA